MARLVQAVYSALGYGEVSDSMRGRDTKGLQKFQRFVLKPAIIALLVADGIGYFIARSTMNDSPPVPQGWEDRSLAAAVPTYVPAPGLAGPEPVARVDGTAKLAARSGALDQVPLGTDDSEPDPELSASGPAELPEQRLAASRQVLDKRVRGTARLEPRSMRPANSAFARAFSARFKLSSAATGDNRPELTEPVDRAGLLDQVPPTNAALPEISLESMSAPAEEPLTSELPALSEPTRAVNDQQTDSPVLPASTENVVAEPSGAADSVTSQATPVGTTLQISAAAVSNLAPAILVADRYNHPAHEDSVAQHAAGLAATNGSVSRSIPEKHHSADGLSLRGLAVQARPAAPSETLATRADREAGLTETGFGDSLSAIESPGALSRGVDQGVKTVGAQSTVPGPSIRLGDLLAAVEPAMDIGEFRKLSGSKNADALVTLETLKNYGIPVEYDSIERIVSTPAGTKIKIAA